jgi:hypothetical protein
MKSYQEYLFQGTASPSNHPIMSVHVSDFLPSLVIYFPCSQSVYITVNNSDSHVLF